MMTKMLTAQVMFWRVRLTINAGWKVSCPIQESAAPTLLKKAGLDSSSRANYWPISNLSTVSKIPE